MRWGRTFLNTFALHYFSWKIQRPSGCMSVEAETVALTEWVLAPMARWLVYCNANGRTGAKKLSYLLRLLKERFVRLLRPSFIPMKCRDAMASSFGRAAIL